jgi:hypothetical protein
MKTNIKDIRAEVASVKIPFPERGMVTVKSVNIFFSVDARTAADRAITLNKFKPRFISVEPSSSLKLWNPQNQDAKGPFLPLPQYDGEVNSGTGSVYLTFYLNANKGEPISATVTIRYTADGDPGGPIEDTCTFPVSFTAP